jgi:outer membrane protein assembly factor BamB
MPRASGPDYSPQKRKALTVMKTHLLPLAIIAFVLTTNVRAADWPQWRGPHRDGKAADFKAPASWPGELKQKWRVTVGDGVATPALANGKLYVFTREAANEVARCLDADDGKELWQDKYETLAASGPASGYSGPRSSPVVADGKVIFYGLRGTLTCYDAGTGKVLWRKESKSNSWPDFYTSSSPLVEDGLCIAQLGGKMDGAIAALNLGTGDEKWTWTGDGSAYASPVLANVGGMKIIFAQSDKRIVAVNFADGKLMWELPFAGSGRGGLNTATPIVDGQTLVYSGTGRGTTAVRFDKEGDSLKPTQLWTNPDNSIQYNSPVLKNGLIFGYSARDTLFCLDAREAKTLWTSDVPGKRGYGSIVDAGAVLFILTPVGNLIAFEPSDKEFKQLATYNVAEGDTTAYPVIAGNQVFIKGNQSVTLWSFE